MPELRGLVALVGGQDCADAGDPFTRPIPMCANFALISVAPRFE